MFWVTVLTLKRFTRTDRLCNKYPQLRITHSKCSNGGAGRAFWEQRGERRNNTEGGQQVISEGCMEEAVLVLGLGS